MKKLFQTEDKDVHISDIDRENTTALLKVLYKTKTLKLPTNNATERRWERALAKCRSTYKDFDVVFKWFIEKYPSSAYLQNCFKSGTAVRDHFRELRLEREKSCKRFLEIPDTTIIDDDMLEATTQSVMELVPEWATKVPHVRYAVWEYLTLLADIEEYLFDIRAKTVNTNQLLSEICVPAMLQGIHENYVSHYVEFVTHLLKWTDWSGELAGTKLNISRKNPQRVKALLDANIKKMEGVEYSTYSGLRDGIMGTLAREAKDESDEGE